MNELETHARPPVGRLRRDPAAKTGTKTQLGKCLVVSMSPPKREMISLAANEAGWQTVVCADAQHALAAIQRTRFRLAWVDVDSPEGTEGLRDVCQAISGLPKVLLAVVGHVNDTEEEIWARQLGVWLYLPGISLEHASEISILCGQAQIVSDGMQSTR